jgi:hypothetical protein
MPAGSPSAVPEETSGSWNWLLPVVILLLLISVIGNLRWMSAASVANPAEDLWIAAFKDGTPEMKRKGAGALAQIGQASSKSIQALADGLADSSLANRELAIDALTQAGAAAKPALADLIRVQNRDENELLRRRAAEAVAAIRDAPRGRTAGRSLLWMIAGMVVVGLGWGAWMLRREVPMPKKGR